MKPISSCHGCAVSLQETVMVQLREPFAVDDMLAKLILVSSWVAPACVVLAQDRLA